MSRIAEQADLVLRLKRMVDGRDDVSAGAFAALRDAEAKLRTMLATNQRGGAK